ncbi:MAG: cupin domain-containing protein [Maritimibacter sp.]|nr:cupin domain-containing protein [Maritimibacter sp.]
MTGALTADEIIAALDLAPHPEGGWFRETWRAETPGARPAEASGARPTGTAIYFLLKSGERSHWHRVDAAEIWHFHAGAALTLRIAPDAAGPTVPHLLSPDLATGAEPQIIVPAHHWQAAETTGDFTLVSCTVSPGFRFEGFELAPPGFDIPG